MNFVNKFLARKKTRNRVEISKRIEALLLSVLDLTLASLSCSPGILAKKLMQELHQVVRDLRIIAKNGSLNVILPNRLADLLDMEFLEL